MVVGGCPAPLPLELKKTGHLIFLMEGIKKMDVFVTYCRDEDGENGIDKIFDNKDKAIDYIINKDDEKIRKDTYGKPREDVFAKYVEVFPVKE